MSNGPILLNNGFKPLRTILGRSPWRSRRLMPNTFPQRLRSTPLENSQKPNLLLGTFRASLLSFRLSVAGNFSVLARGCSCVYTCIPGGIQARVGDHSEGHPARYRQVAGGAANPRGLRHAEPGPVCGRDCTGGGKRGGGGKTPRKDPG
eukprot:6185609-Pyramimonas_sp.AAC.1